MEIDTLFKDEGRHFDILVVGYTRIKDLRIKRKVSGLDTGFGLSEVITSREDVQKFKLPWSKEDPLLIADNGSSIDIFLPDFTQILGVANKLQCFDNTRVELMEFKEKRFVRVRQSRNDSKFTPCMAKYIAIPKEKQTHGGFALCRKVPPTLLVSDEKHFVNSGIFLSRDCAILVKEKLENLEKSDNPTFLTQYKSYDKVDLRDTSSRDKIFVHDPPEFKKIPFFYPLQSPYAEHVTPGIKVRYPCAIWILTLSACFILVSLGLIQHYGSLENKWGDVINQCLGTGSVVIGVLLSIFYCVFNASIVSLDTLRGEFVLTNDFAARLLAGDDVKVIESMACDPRLPPYLIMNHNNCAVRSPRNGWLAVGQSIKSDNMKNHGYYLIEDKGIVLDILSEKFLVCEKQQRSGIIHLMRSQREKDSRFEIIEKFEGNEIFGGQD